MDRLIYAFVFIDGRHVGGGKYEGEAASLLRMADDENISTHGACEFAGKAEAEPGAVDLAIQGGFTPVKRFEYAFNIGRSNPDAPVFNGNRDGDLASKRRREPGDAHPVAARSVLDGVADEVLEAAGNGAGIADRIWKFGIDRAL